MDTKEWTIKIRMTDPTYVVNVEVWDKEGSMVGLLDLTVQASQGPISKELLKFVAGKLEAK